MEITERLVRDLLAAINDGAVDRIGPLVAENFVDHGAADEASRNVSALAVPLARDARWPAVPVGRRAGGQRLRWRQVARVASRRRWLRLPERPRRVRP
jgi:hypothetical protein